jgi:hypothetical protein
VPVSVHPAPDVLGFRLAHVFIIVAAFVDSFEIVLFPVLMIAINMVKVNPFIIYEL